MALRGWQTEILILHLSDPINEYWAASFGHSTATPELLMIDAEAASLNWRPVSFWSADASDFWRAVGVSCTSVSIVSQISDPCGEETPTRRTKAT